MTEEKRGGFDLHDNPERNYTPGKSWFLGIGINEYKEFRDLNNAVKDVNDIKDLLMERYGLDKENAFLLFDKEADEENIIFKLRHLAKSASENDKVIIYYSGHGKVDEFGFGYWLPYDAKVETSSRYISNSIIRDWIKVIKARHILLIADSCFSGSLLQEGETRSTTSAIDELEAMASRWAICSGRGDEEVYDGKPGGNSPFTESIIEILSANVSGPINISNLFNRVMMQTRDKYGQLPQGRPLVNVGHKGGQYIFRPKSEDDQNLWEKTLNAGTIEAYEAYIAAFYNGLFATEAKDKLKDLKDEKAWSSATQKNTIGAYALYLELHPEGKYRDDAQKALDSYTSQPVEKPVVSPKVRMQKNLMLNGLYNLLSLGGDGNFVIFDINDGTESFIQAATEKGADYVYLEASTYNINEDQKRKLESLGWELPDEEGSGNYSKRYTYGNINDLDPVIDWIYKTFKEVYGVTEDTDIEPNLNLE